MSLVKLFEPIMLFEAISLHNRGLTSKKKEEAGT